jgi:hypothetical protein
MHEVFRSLARRVETARTGVAQVLNEVEKQLEVESKTQDEAEQGDDFDDETAQIQAEVVGALQAALGKLEAADDALDLARTTLEDVTRR